MFFVFLVYLTREKTFKLCHGCSVSEVLQLVLSRAMPKEVTSLRSGVRIISWVQGVEIQNSQVLLPRLSLSSNIVCFFLVILALCSF